MNSVILRVKSSLCGGGAYNCRRHEIAWSANWDFETEEDPHQEEEEESVPSWKFWRHFTLRRGNDKKSKSDLYRADGVDPPTDSLDNEKGKWRRSNSLKPPPKPPRLFLFRSSSVSTPRDSVAGNMDRSSQGFQSRARDNNNIPTAHVTPVRQETGLDNDPNNKDTENNNKIVKSGDDTTTNNVNIVRPTVHSTTNNANVIPPSQNNTTNNANVVQPRLRNSGALNNNANTKIKIVTPDLTPRRNINRSRRTTEVIPQSDRHKLILQNSYELLCQKLDPSSILSSLEAQKVLPDEDILAFRGHPDRRLVCESLVHSLLEGSFFNFMLFCDILRKTSEYKSIASILDTMKEVYDVIFDVPASTSDEIPILEEEKTVSFEVGYYNVETGIMKPVVELEKARDSSKRYSRDSLLLKRASRLSFSSMSSDATKQEEVDMELHGTPMINICISGHSLHGDRAKSLAGVLDKFSCILELRIGKTQLNGRDVGYLSVPIQIDSSLCVLDLRLNQIGNEGARLLAAPLQKNTRLKVLNISSTGIDHEGCKHLSEALKQNNTLTEFDLSFLEIGDSGCISLGNMLKQNKSLSKLRVRSANITWIGCGILFEGVQQSKSLKELDLSRNFIGDDGMEMMCRHLSEKCSLVDLNLENCGITSAGCSLLSDVILMNKTMQHLDLSVNFIADAGITKLSAALERNKTIKTLGLNMCGITNDGFAKILDILECNPTLTMLKLCYNRLGREYSNPSASSDDLRYRVRIVTSSNPKLKLLLWGNAFDDG
ncbi:hypothetical protein FSP39_017158 [Pinctada imbricata]|uniref:Uncharacterized protein n=1 Tax=Pinctada imbricata TaxID=66713 RepID=A0AA88YDM0_PINIB|nr:hypothetical protein FSP39_017158 [Pinctada imbricata]